MNLHTTFICNCPKLELVQMFIISLTDTCLVVFAYVYVYVYVYMYRQTQKIILLSIQRHKHATNR